MELSDDRLSLSHVSDLAVRLKTETLERFVDAPGVEEYYAELEPV